MTIFEGLLKTSLDKVEPSLINSYSVGSIEWHAGNYTITEIDAKINSGNAAFNLVRVPKNQFSPVGWQWNNLSGSFGEDLDVAWQFKAYDLGPSVMDGVSDGDPVSTWYSFDMNARFQQGTVSARPLYYSGSYGPGGVRDAVSFTGAHGMSILEGQDTFSSDFTLFVVLGEFDASQTNQPILTNSDKNRVGEAALYAKQGRMFFQDDDLDYIMKSSPASAIPGEDEIRCVQFDAGSDTCSEYVDGTAVYEGLSGPSGTFTFNTVGHLQYSGTDEYMSGAISEIIMFNNTLDEDQRQIMEGYLAYKYGLQNNLASSHPYKTVYPFLESTGGSTNYLLSNHILCSSTYGDGEAVSQSINNGDRLEFYVPGCQNPGQITIKLTYS